MESKCNLNAGVDGTITLHAVAGDAGKESSCDLRCKAGFYHAEGNAIPFTCAPNTVDRMSEQGTAEPLTKCKGV